MKKLKRFSLVVITALCAVCLSACGLSGKLPVDMPQASGQGETQTQSENLVVHYLDVGQGDSEFIELPNGETMLIDAGETDKGETVVNDISALGCNKITYLVATHPHSDHIGGMPAVLDAFDVANAPICRMPRLLRISTPNFLISSMPRVAMFMRRKTMFPLFKRKVSALISLRRAARVIKI